LSPLDIIALPAPKLFVSIVHPQITIKTSEARKILPVEVPLKEAVKQWGNIAGLVAGLYKNDFGLIGRSLTDYLVEPVRSKLIPGFDEIKTYAGSLGALGGGISGSGPSIFMLSESKNIAEAIQSMMNEVYERIGIHHKTYVSTINTEGITVTQ
jgi:homoserine kinase